MQLPSPPIHIDVHDTTLNKSLFFAKIEKEKKVATSRLMMMMYCFTRTSDSLQGPGSDLEHLKGPQMDPTEKEMGPVATPEEKYID